MTPNQKWLKKNPEYMRDYCKRRLSRNPNWRREMHLQERYGISLKKYNAMLTAQGGRCALCGRMSADAMGRSFPVDHCHRTQRVRGLLCFGCNRWIGKLEKMMPLLKKSLRYLQGIR